MPSSSGDLDDLAVLKMGDKLAATAGPLMRASGWRAGQWVRYVEPQVPPVSEYTVEKSDGVTAAGILMYGSENYSSPRVSTYRNYTSNGEPAFFILLLDGFDFRHLFKLAVVRIIPHYQTFEFGFIYRSNIIFWTATKLPLCIRHR